MYNKADYLKRGSRFANNILRPHHKKLSSLMFYSTDLCNSRCLHCRIWEKKPSTSMPLEKIKEIMQSKCITKDTNIGMEGGEFLMHPEYDKILNWFSTNHPKFDLLTNCLQTERVIESVKKYNPQRLYVSLDGTEETYKYMRGRDGFNKVIKVIENCKDIIPISAMFTLTPYNSFNDMKEVIDICNKYNIDIRIGIYNNISFFDTVDEAHKNSFDKINKQYEENHKDFKNSIPKTVKATSENYDFLILYDEWQKKNLNIRCHSLYDSIVIHPNGDVPVCQNLEQKLGNVYKNTLDEIINSKKSVSTQKDLMKNCNGCWINFHRKYDIVLLRNMEKFLPKKLIETFYGKYQWDSNRKTTYRSFMRKYN